MILTLIVIAAIVVGYALCKICEERCDLTGIEVAGIVMIVLGLFGTVVCVTMIGVARINVEGHYQQKLQEREQKSPAIPFP